MRQLVDWIVGFFGRTPAVAAADPPGAPAESLEEAAARLARLSGKAPRPYSTRDFGREQNPAGRSVVVPSERDKAIVEQLRREITAGLVAFIGCTNSLNDPPDRGSEIVVADGRDQFDILRIAQSDAVNYGMETEDLIRKLQQYDSEFGIDIFHAETDIIEFRFRQRPSDMTAFCEDLYEFCPDIVDQGAGSIEALEEGITRTGEVLLWWD